jgi:hypothetical protein
MLEADIFEVIKVGYCISLTLNPFKANLKKTEVRKKEKKG